MKPAHRRALLALAALFLTSARPIAFADPPSDTGGVLIPATWVYDAVVKDNSLYFAAESTSGSGEVFKLVSDAEALCIGRFDSACLSLGSAQGMILVGMHGGGRVFRSTNDGDSWQTVFSPPGSNDVYCLSEQADGDLLAGTGSTSGNVFRSMFDCGIGGAVAPGTWIRDAVVKDSVAYFAAESTSGSGEVFKLVSDTEARCIGRFDSACLSLGSAQGILFVGMHGGGRVSRTTNDGASWQAAFGPPGSNDVYCMSEQADGNLLAGTGSTSGNVFRSMFDCGIGGAVAPGTWVHDAVVKDNFIYFAAESTSGSGEVFKLVSDTEARCIGRFDSACLSLGFAQGMVLVGMHGGGRVFRSTSDGDSWQAAFGPPGSNDVYCMSERADGDLLAGTGSTSGNVFRSMFNCGIGGGVLSGASWVNDALSWGGRLWAGSGPDTGLVWRSTDAGVTWQRCPGTAWSNTASLAAAGGCIYAGTGDSGRVYVSFDTGSTWLTPGNLPGATCVHSLTLSTRALPNRLLAGTGDATGAVFASHVLGRCDVRTKSPDPNPAMSTVMQGGTFHRYYETLDSAGHTAPGVWVTAACGSDTGQFVSGSDGVVDVFFSTGYHQPGACVNGAVTAVSGRRITPIQFGEDVEDRRYDRSYVFDASLSAGGRVIAPGVELFAAKSKVSMLSGTCTAADTLDLSNKAELGGDYSPVSAAVGLSVNVDNFTLGAYAGGDLLKTGGCIHEDHNSRFPYPVPASGLQSLAATLLFLDDRCYSIVSPYAAPIVEWLVSLPVAGPLREAAQEKEIGIDVFAGSGGEFHVGGIVPTGYGLGSLGYFSANGQIGGDLHGIASFGALPRESLGFVQAEQYGEGSVGASVDFRFSPPPSTPPQAESALDQMGITRWSGGHLGFGFNGKLDACLGVYSHGGSIRQLAMTFVKDSSSSSIAETHELTFESPDTNVMNDFTASLSTNLIPSRLVALSRGIGVARTLIDPGGVPIACCELFKQALAMQLSGRDLQVEHKVYRTDANLLHRFDFNLGIPAKVFDLTIGADGSTRNEKRLLISDGVWLCGRFFNRCVYSDDAYTQQRQDVEQVGDTLLAHTLTLETLAEIFQWFAGILHPDNGTLGLVLKVDNCSLAIPTGALPVGDTVAILAWHWLPETSVVSGPALRRYRVGKQLQAGLQLGIGGFYSVKPETSLAESATLQISYADSEVVGINETTLAIYRWNDTTSEWIFVGGTVKPESNFVRASIQRLGIFSIAPPGAAGSIPLEATPDSLPARGTDTVLINGGPVYNNNGQQVPNGTLITVSASAGAILTQDADTLVSGIQVPTTGGGFQFKVLVPDIAAVATMSAVAVFGQASGSTDVKFWDVAAPLPPVITQVSLLDSITVQVIWMRNAEPDVLGYRLYYGTDSLPPYEGCSPYDLASPIDVGDDTTRIVALRLDSDSTYYVCVTAYDVSGLESQYSEVREIEPGNTISGSISYYSNQSPVESARVCVNGYRADTSLTDSIGAYALSGLSPNYNYSVAPYRIEAGQSPAVSAYDAALVLQYAVGRDTLDSLQLLAGDVSGNGSVSAYDAALILQYAVGRIQHFPVGIRGDDTVDWAFGPPSRTYDSLASDQNNQDYQGILYGDPSGNWPGFALPGGDVTDVVRTAFFTLNMPVEEKPNTQVPIRNQHPSPKLQVPIPSAVSSGVSMVLDEKRKTASGEQSSVVQEPSAVSREPSAVLVFPITAKGARDVVSADILVKYDTRSLRLVGLRTTQATRGFLVAASDRGGSVRIAMAGTRKLNGDLTLLELLFSRTTECTEDTENPKVTRNPENETADGRRQTLTSPSSQSSPQTGEDGTRGSEAAPSEGAVGGRLPTIGGQPSTGSLGAKTPGYEGGTAQTAKSAESAADTPVQLVWIVLNENVPPKLTPAAGGAQGERADLPSEFFLSPPVPNPFGSGTMVSFGLPRQSDIKVCVFDASGRLARTLAKGARPAGRYSLVWDGKDNQNRQLKSGVYFVRLETEGFQSERKAVLLRQ